MSYFSCRLVLLRRFPVDYKRESFQVKYISKGNDRTGYKPVLASIKNVTKRAARALQIVR